MDINLKGKNVLVCGGSSGIGKASAMLLANMGANVTILARNEDTLFETLKQLDHSEGQIHDMIVADTSQEEDFKGSLVALTKKRSIHILVNNSGGPPSGNIVDANTDAFKDAFNQHLIANHIAVQTLLPGMKKEGYGRIINIISTSVKQPLRGLGVSNTIRAAVGNWSKTLATELAPFGITVNNVLPGATETERLKSIVSIKASKTGMAVDDVQKEMLSEIPMGRFGTAEEIANAVGFLASPAAAYITGTQITVDGGRTGVL